MRYVMNSNAILKQGFQDHKGPFQVFSSHGPVIILPHHMLDEIRNDDRLSFLKLSAVMFMRQYSGLETFHVNHEEHRIFLAVIKQSLTQSLSAITGDMAKETYSMLNELLSTVTEDWSPVCLAPITPFMAARLSAKVFLGDQLCHNKEWLNISVFYTINAVQAVQKMRHWPPFMRSIVQYFLPEFKMIRNQIKLARTIIEPEIAERKRKRRDAVMTGKPVPRPADALEWMDAQAEGKPFDKVLAQILMSFVSIHTTSGTLLGLMYDLISHPEHISALRTEIADVLKAEGGWTKTTLHKMKLLDSCLKESQRLHPMNAILMNRLAITPVTLSDGTRLPAGAMVGIPTYPMNDTSSPLYARPAAFDGRRFLRLRAHDDNRWQFVATSPEHYGFGHGKQSCNEIKIVVAHLLLLFDWRFEEGGEPRGVSVVDCEFVPDLAQRVLVRRRVPEVDLGGF
ncbi:putative cytochrome p450 protein [Neofusicoccum parvum]|nr:putative cytochrome p450 protein [Neofusicoccum parvum]